MRVTKGTAVGVAAFGIGYLLGTTINDRPVRFLRRSAERTRARMNTLSVRASRLAPWTRRDDERVVDVRRVREVMTPIEATIGPKTTLREAAALMQRSGVADLVVVKKQRVRGLVSDRDIALRAVANGLDPTGTRVSDVMTRTEVVVGADAPMDEAISLMHSTDMHRVVVVEGGLPVGILTGSDVGLTEARSVSATRWLLRSG